MKISPRSWHYRFNSYIQDDKFTYRAECGRFTTCSYIRACIATCFTALFRLVVILLVGALVLWVALSALIVPFVIWYGAPVAGIFSVAAAAAWIAVAFILAALFIKQVKDRLSKAFTINREPNVFVQAIIDRHNKFCTRVEVV